MNRSGLYLLLLFISIMLLNVGDDGRSRTSVEDALVARQKELDTIHNMTYGVNVTHPTPPVVRSEKQALLDHAHSEHPAHFYHNVTGVFKGDWHAENVTFVHLNRTAADEARGSFAYDGLGQFTLNLKCIATEDEDISYIEAHMRMRDDDRSDYGVLLFAEGLHFLTNGSLYLYGVPDSHGIPLNDLLQTLPSNDTFMRARRVVEDRLQERIGRLQEMLRFGYDTTEDEESPYSVLTDCEFEMLIQLQPVPKNIKMSQLLEYERELQNPQGVTTIRAPPLIASFIIYSPNCGVLISAPDAPGLKVEKYYAKAINYAAMVSLLALTQIFLLIHQMEYTPTPSSVSKVSYWTIAIQSVMDGYLCLLHLTTGVVVDHVFIPFATAAFFTFILVSIFGMRYLLVIWRIQRPEYTRNVTQQTVSAATGAAAPQRNEAGTEGAEGREVRDETVEGEGERAAPIPAMMLPAPVTAPRPVVRQTEERSDLGILYYRFYTALLLGLILFYQTAARSIFVQNLILGGFALALFSFWVPQIVRNAVRGSRRGLSLYYVAGMSVTRLATPLYFYGCPHNLLGHEATPWVWGLAAYVALQALVLVAQEYFGPRFFVPEQYLPPTYNYHPILPPTDEESAADDDGADDDNAHTPRQQDGGAYPRRPHYAQPHGRDCAICMLPVDTGAPGSTATAAVPILGRAAYMVTPCHHLFHTECLERWMRIKLECPVCRSFLPSS